VELRIGKPEEVGVSAERVANVTQLAESWVEEGTHPSLAVLAARRGVIFLHEAFGRMGPEEGAPALNKGTIFPLASISKPITATAVMMLVEESRLGLNRPIRDYIPEFEGEGKHQVLIRQLLTHTSGLLPSTGDDRGALIEFVQSEGIELDEARITSWISGNTETYLGLFYKTPLLKPPETEMVYSDANYDLLGDIVHRVSGKGLSEFAEERIFKPLGMENTHYIVPDSALDQVVRRSSDAPDYDLTNEFLKTELGSAGAYSTVMDMAIFGQMFLNRGTYSDKRILSRASIEAMMRNQIPGIGVQIGDERLDEAEWGLGWSTHINNKVWRWDELLQSQTSLVHGGSGGVMLWVDPAYEFVAAYFAVYPGFRDNGWPVTNADLFINAALASIVEL
jgi:CubicO group peptidase (beta-lactamase class C family)